MENNPKGRVPGGEGGKNILRKVEQGRDRVEE